MPRKYQIEVSFDLTTEIEASFYGSSFDTSEVEDFNDGSYWPTQDIRLDGGDLAFTVEAESEEEAEEKAHSVVREGDEVEDSNGLTWEVGNVDYSVELIEVPMDLARATTLIREYLAAMEGMDEELESAFDFLLALVSTVPTLAERDAEIRRLQGELAAATATPFDAASSA